MGLIQIMNLLIKTKQFKNILISLIIPTNLIIRSLILIKLFYLIQTFIANKKRSKKELFLNMDNY